jgi:hypothetical protein
VDRSQANWRRTAEGGPVVRSSVACPDAASDKSITENLVIRLRGLRVAKGRFLKADKSWVAGWKFAPLTNLNASFDLLEAANSNYTLRTNTSGASEAKVQVGERGGRVSGEPKARTISHALANALGLDDIPSGPEPEKLPNGNHPRRGRSGL